MNEAARGKFTRISNTDVEMTPIQVQNGASSPPPSGAPSPIPKVPLDRIINHAKGPFEKHPKLQGGASAFESNWNAGHVVDVWGVTLESAPMGEKVTPLLNELHLLRIASGTVSGVEKMYWIAVVTGSKSPQVLGMVEISVHVATKRLSAVFKTSRVASREELEHLHTLFNAFKRVIEDNLC